MKIYRSILFIFALVTISLPLVSPSQAEDQTNESTTIEFPITRDGFIKSYSAPAFDWNGGYISIGNDGSVYKDGLTRGLFQYDLWAIKETGINTENLTKAELITTFYRANKNAPRPFPIRIDPYDHELPSKLVYWPERKDSLLTSIIEIPIISGQKNIDITNILTAQLNSERQIDGIQLSAEPENSGGIFFYSNECTKYDLFYNPECSQGMEPYLRIQYKHEKPIPVKIIITDLFRTTLDTVEIEWESEKPQFYEVQISRVPDFSETELSSQRSDLLNFQFLPLDYSTYYLRVLSYLSENATEFAISETLKIEFFDLSTYIPEITQDDDYLSIFLPNDALTVHWEISSSQQFANQNEIGSNSTNLQLRDVCSHPTNRFIRTYLANKGGNRSLYSDIIRIDCPSATFGQPSLPFVDPDFPFNNIPDENIALIPEKAFEHTFKMPEPLNTEEVKGAETLTENINYEHATWESNQKNSDPSLKCSIITNLNGDIVSKSCNKLNDPLKKAKLISENGSTLVKLSYRLPRAVELQNIRKYCQNELLSKLPILCPNTFSRVEASYAFKIHVNGKTVSPISQKVVSEDQSNIIELTIASADKVQINTIEAEIFLKGQHFGLIPLGSYKNDVDLKTQNEKIVQKPFIYPFSKNIGVTQWHGKTVFSDHTGIDFGSANEEVRAIGDGEVIATGYDTYLGKCHSGGYFINIKHTNDHHSVYMHLKDGSIKFKTGDSIQKGQIIATSGNSGAYNCQPLGYHLHMETREKREQSSHYNPVNTIQHDWNKILTLGVATYPGRLSGDNPHPTY